MRHGAYGMPGKYTCDRCGKRSSSGVYTGMPVFTHVCQWCLDIGKRMDLTKWSAILAPPVDWVTIGAGEASTREKQAATVKAVWEGKR